MQIHDSAAVREHKPQNVPACAMSHMNLLIGCRFQDKGRYIVLPGV
jgi:hypothetical protein